MSIEFESPNSWEILKAQSSNETERLQNLRTGDSLWFNPNGVIWISDTATDLQLMLCIISLIGYSVQRGQDSTERALRSTYFLSAITTDVRTFVRVFIHCLSNVGGRKVPRPSGPAGNGSVPNDLLQLDYIELGPSTDGDKYVLKLRDELSYYIGFSLLLIPPLKMLLLLSLIGALLLVYLKPSCLMDRLISRTKE